MTQKDYNEIKKDLLDHPEWPYHFANSELAEDFFKRLKEEYPEAMFFASSLYGQFLCLGDESKRKLMSIYADAKAKAENNLAQINKELEELSKAI